MCVLRRVLSCVFLRYWVHIEFFWGNGKENGNCYNGLYRRSRVYIGGAMINRPPPFK